MTDEQPQPVKVRVHADWSGYLAAMRAAADRTAGPDDGE